MKKLPKIALGTWSWGEGFAGGDTVLGPKTVAKAVCQGLDAAESMHRYMQGRI